MTASSTSPLCDLILRAARFALAAALALLPMLFFGPASARAGDPVEDARVAEAETLLERLAAWTEAEDKPSLETALPRVVKSHNELQTKAVRAKLQKAVGELLGIEALGAIRLAAADTLGQLNDPKGAYDELRGHLPSVKEAAVGPVPLRVIQAVGALAPDAAIASLVSLMEKAEDANVSRYAIQALGRYGWSRQRAKVLSSLAEYLRRLRPAGGNRTKGRGGGEEARQRYDFLQQTLVAALRELTGQDTLDTGDKWLEAWDEHKRNPAKLFTFER
ncbi:MAG: hypothetical protein O2894_05445 [Planctomycetota bacterium]|nr:hypothetical protein [Planctomycetota bacterium]